MYENDELDSAVLLVTKNFVHPNGLLDKFEKNIEINKNELDHLLEAMEIIYKYWIDKKEIPKDVARALLDVLPRLEKCLTLYPQKKEDIVEIIEKIGFWIEKIFSTPQMTEEQAITIVSQHVIGLSFAVAIQNAIGTSEGMLADFLFALETLEQAWKNKDQISKLAAGALISAQTLFEDFQTHYSKPDKQHMQKAIQEIRNHITRCFN